MEKNLSKISALILCGGLGQRLQAVTQGAPKVLAKVNDKPFLDILIGYLKNQGIRNIVLCTGYKADILENHYAGHFPGVDIVFSREETPLGTGGAIKNAQPLVKGNPFFVFNGDSFCALDLEEFLDYFLKKNAQACLAVSKTDDSRDFGGITLNDHQEIVSFKEKQVGGPSYVNAGIYCLSSEVFKLMPQEDRFSLETNFFPTLLGKQFFGFITDKPFYDIGTPERYQKAQSVLKF
ncbi:MAG: nucleotidyltransferase family protein [Candidatus Omnitrophica bacterium]|nr:nucleotidyltransferase family protein [Candidatus Omnitrophota bacterium]